VPIDYDPLLAKLIGYGTDRDQAIARLTRALDEYFVGGIKTNIPLFRRILRDADFRAAKLDTGFLDRMLRRAEAKPVDSNKAEVAAVAAGIFAAFGSPFGSTPAAASEGKSDSDSHATGKADSNWKSAARREALR